MTVQIPDSLDIEGMPAMIRCDMFIELCPRIVRLDDEAASASYPGNTPKVLESNCFRAPSECRS